MNSYFTKVTTLLVASVLVASSGCNSESKNVGCPSRATNVSFFKTQNVSIQTDCLDKQYSPASGIYIEPQQCTFDIRNNSLELKTNEGLDQDLKTLLSYSILYSSRVNIFSHEAIQQGDHINIDGEKYSAIERTIKDCGQKTVKIRFYCRLNSLLVDRLELENDYSGKTISSLCYDFTYVDKIPNAFATKIDIFSGKATNFDKIKVREFEYRNFKVINTK